ncbi:unnamed protein product [Phaedon cochleariae]|uniref:Small ribosomal subunit protein uS10m n=1 Tax=Phaedon cochleariae TaxID=80249 RepID=A0A9P0GSF3_PHACE|nr:unnamed protein product [Phaedon cochleariae]
MNIIRQILRSPKFPRNAPKQFSIATQTSQNDEETDQLYKIVELELRGNDAAVLRSFSKFAVTTGNHFEIDTKSWTLRKPTHERYTVLKSAHIYKKHRVQYEVRTYYSFIQFKHLTGSTADTLLEYIERNLPEGVALKATKVELQELPSYLSTPPEKSKVLQSEVD